MTLIKIHYRELKFQGILLTKINRQALGPPDTKLLSKPPRIYLYWNTDLFLHIRTIKNKSLKRI